MANQWRTKLAQWIAPRSRNKGRVGTRQYSSAFNSRLTTGFGTTNSSADSELATSLLKMRMRSRQLVRDTAFAKRAKVIVVNNVIGHGMPMQAQVKTTRGEFAETINESIESAWEEWCCADSCHTGGQLHFADLERAAFGQIFEAGEVFIRIHRRPFGDSKIPFALELIEAERMADDLTRTIPLGPNNQLRMGIEVDTYYRPVTYWLREQHPGEINLIVPQSNNLVPVPAEDMIHLRIIERWPQTRGEPWMHSVIRKLNDIDGYTEAEIIAARSAASYMGFIESDNIDDPNNEVQDDGSLQTELTPGIIDRLRPGEKFNFATPNRPNSQAEAFLRFMLREMAAGTGVSYESLSRDYSQSNYSSSRLALLDDRDLWRTFQLWWMRSFREELHEEWLQAAVLAGAVNVPLEQYATSPEKFEAVSFKARGWSWIDPTSEVAAYKEAVKAGFITVSEVIAQTGNGLDLEDVLEERGRELKEMQAQGLDFDTSPGVFIPAETRGNMIMGTDGLVEPAQTAAPGPAPSNEPAPPARTLSIAR